MLAVHNSKERDADDWAALFKAADPGFDLVGIVSPPGFRQSVIEVVWRGGEKGKGGGSGSVNGLGNGA